ncbi:Gfo/Idh/MocA family protein, partial [Parolsenella catena]
PAWAQIWRELPRLGRLRRATFRFGKYSSRYDDVKAGRHTNIFDASMASGALMDLGVYCIEPMVALFGVPERVVAAPTLISDAQTASTNGIIDGAGSVLCSYGRRSGTPGLVVELAYSKISTDLLPCQIEGDLGTLTLDAMSVPQAASVMVRGQAVRGAATTKANAVGSVTEQLAIEPCDNNMVFELRDFVSVVRGEKLDTLWGSGMDARGAESSFTDVTLDALAVCDEIRHQAGIHFPADFRVE